MDSIKVSITDPSIKTLLRATYPDYRGRKIRVVPTERPVDVTSYWSGGSRSYFKVVDLRSMRCMGVPQNGTPFDGGPIAPNGVVVPIGFAIVEDCHFSNQRSIYIHCHPQTVTPFLPAGPA